MKKCIILYTTVCNDFLRRTNTSSVPQVEISTFQGPHNNIIKINFKSTSIFNFHNLLGYVFSYHLKEKLFRNQTHKASLRMRGKHNQRNHTWQYSFLIQAGPISPHWGRGKRGEILSEPVSIVLLTNCLNNCILDNPLITLLGAYA